jgi:meso-butanediol dehydrogenase/(S,S)-butanediol dehydrogenase/diacetyl reductase
MGRLDDRVALITGGAGAIGRATARRFLDDGARVAIADRSDTALERVAEELGAGGADRVTTHAVDVTSDASVRDLTDAVVAAHGRIDVLFTCAGVLAPGSVTETSLDDWDRTLATNLTGPFPHVAACRAGHAREWRRRDRAHGLDRGGRG